MSDRHLQNFKQVIFYTSKCPPSPLVCLLGYPHSGGTWAPHQTLAKTTPSPIPLAAAVDGTSGGGGAYLAKGGGMRRLAEAVSRGGEAWRRARTVGGF
jgi:hypothetical protein